MNEFNEIDLFSHMLEAAFAGKGDFWTVVSMFFDRNLINKKVDMPESKMRLYACIGAFNCEFFDSVENLKEYVSVVGTEYGQICTLDYLGNVGEIPNVIKLTDVNGNYILLEKERGLRQIYSAFRERGAFENEDENLKTTEDNDSKQKVKK